MIIYVEKKGGPIGPPRTTSVGTADLSELRGTSTLPLMLLIFTADELQKSKVFRNRRLQF
jgi:hypothetical protein